MLIRWIYSTLLFFASPFLLYGLYKSKLGKPTVGSRWKEHFGLTPRLNALKNPLWIHAVSVGETIAVTPLIKRLKEQNPELNIVITTTTATGAQQAEKLAGIAIHRYMPLDFPFAIKRFIKTINPCQLLIMETELWPNTLYTVANHGIPISIINARLSERSCQRYAKFPFIFNLFSKHLTQALCQYPDDAERFLRLGLDKSRVHVTGSIKFDIDIDITSVSKGNELREALGDTRPIWVAASTHAGEDEQILTAHKLLLDTYPNALLILVPRHPERFNFVYELSKRTNFNTTRRTDESSDSYIDTQVYIGNTMGEMLTFFQAANICFVGGSLLGDKVGGHNVLEPAALRKPVISGPSYYNFAQIVQRMIGRQAIIVTDCSQDLCMQLHKLFRNPKTMLQMGEQAYRCVLDNKGAIESTIQLTMR